jgi:hypothetical protein
MEYFYAYRHTPPFLVVILYGKKGVCALVIIPMTMPIYYSDISKVKTVISGGARKR